MTAHWLARNAAYIAVMAILLTAAAWCWRQNRRYPGPPSRLGQILDGQRVDSMLDVVKPGLFVTAGRKACGCQITTTPDGVHITPCSVHDPQFVTEWEQRLSQ